MKLRYIFMTVFILVVIMELSFSQTTEINISQNTYVCDCEPIGNFSGSTLLYQGPYYTGGHNCFAKSATYWNLDSIPKGIHITNATIELKCKSIYGTLSGQMVFYRFVKKWEEIRITDSGVPPHTSQDSIVSDWPAAGKWLIIDATKLVQFWYEHPDSNFGLYGHCINTTAGTGAVGLYSSYHSAIADRPKLTVTYSTTDVGSKETQVPSNFKLHAYPNPFNPTTNISYTLTQSAQVNLKILDLQGRVIERLVNSFQSIGDHQIQWNANKQASGIYLISISSEKKRSVEKVVLMK